jgi:hypothetical protein
MPNTAALRRLASTTRGAANRTTGLVVPKWRLF